MSVTKRLVLSVLLFLFAFNSFADKKETEHILTEDQETQFNYVFMEGVRCKILGDLKSAITYFDQCMKLYKGSAAVRYELASILALGDDLTLPLQLMREAVKLEPDNIWYKLLLANILQKKSMIDEACAVYDELIAQHPDREDFYLVETGLYTSVEKWEKAIEVLDRHEARFGLNESVTVEKAKLYAQLKDIKKASSEIMKLVKAYPEKTDYLGLLAELYLSNDEEKKGLQVLEKVVKKEPDNGFAQLFMADYYYSKGDTVESERLLRNVLVNDRVDNGLKVQYLLKLLVNQKELNLSVEKVYGYERILLERYPDDLSVRTLNADFLKRMNQLDLCVKELEFLISKDPDNFVVWEELLLMYNQIQDTASMYEKGLECLRHFPNEPLPYLMVSLPLLLERNIDGALLYLKRGVELAEDGTVIKAQFYSYLGDCYYEQDSVDLAFKMYDEVLKINPNDVLVLNNYSYFLALRGERLEEAEEMISRAVSLNPNNGTFLDTYAWVLFKRKNYSLAKFYIRSAIEDEQSVSGVLYEHYGDILYMNGEKEEAVKMWQKAMQVGGDVEIDKIVDKIKNGLSTDDEE